MGGDFEDLENLLNDKKNVKSQRERKKKKKKKKNYLKSLEDEELETWDPQKFEVLVGEWSVIRLEKEMKSTEKQIKEIKQRKMSKHNVSDSEEDLDALTADQIIERFNDLTKDRKHHKNTQHSKGEDPSKLYCVCRRPYDGTNSMICCDYCQEWYHLECIGLSADKLQSVEKLKFK